MASKTPLYERIVKRLTQGKTVLLKKNDGSFSVALRMNGKKIVRTEFNSYSALEAKRQADEERNLRLSTEEYLNGDGTDEHGIIILETIDGQTESKPTATLPHPMNECVDYDADLDDDDDDLCEDDEELDNEFPAPGYSRKGVVSLPTLTEQTKPALRNIKKIVLD